MSELFESHGDKLPKGRTYPLKPSEFEREIAASGISLRVEFTRWDKFDSVFQASFYPVGTWLGNDREFFWVYCRAVPSGNARAANRRILSEAIPMFIDWAKHIEGLDDRSPIRREKQTFRYSLEEFAA